MLFRSLHFPHLDREIETRENESIFQSARRHGVRIVGACGGRGSCGSCVVRVQGDVVPMQRGLGAEVDEAADAGLNESIDPTAGDAQGNAGAARKWRRACQLSARSDCRIEVAPRSLAPVVRAETDTGAREVLPLAAAVRVHDLALPAATLQDHLSDTDRVLRALDEAHGRVDLEAARALPGVLRARDHAEVWPVRAFLHGDELMHFAPAGQIGRAHV